MQHFTREPSFELFVHNRKGWDPNRINCTRIHDLKALFGAEYNGYGSEDSTPTVCDGESSEVYPTDDKVSDEESHTLPSSGTEVAEDVMLIIYREVIRDGDVDSFSWTTDLQEIVDYVLGAAQVLTQANMLLRYYARDEVKSEMLRNKKMSIYQAWLTLKETFSSHVVRRDIYGAPSPHDLLLTFVSKIHYFY